MSWEHLVVPETKEVFKQQQAGHNVCHRSEERSES